MTGFNYAAVAATADKTIRRMGRELVITRRIEGDYNPSTGSISVEELAQPVQAVVLDYGIKNIDGALVQQGDKQLLISTVDVVVAPTEGDMVTIDGVIFTIMMVKEVNPAGTVVLYDCNIRK